MDLVFAAVYRGGVPLVQHCPRHGNYDLFFNKFLERISSGKTLIQVENYLWGIQMEDNGLIFIVVMPMTCNQTQLDRVLMEIKARFLRNHASAWKKAAPFSLQTSFEPQLSQMSRALLNTPLRTEELPAGNKTASPLVTSLEPSLSPAKPSAVTGLRWGAAIATALLLVYVVLIVSCGGPSLRPGCR